MLITCHSVQGYRVIINTEWMQYAEEVGCYARVYFGGRVFMEESGHAPPAELDLDMSFDDFRQALGLVPAEPILVDVAAVR